MWKARAWDQLAIALEGEDNKDHLCTGPNGLTRKKRSRSSIAKASPGGRYFFFAGLLFCFGVPFLAHKLFNSRTRHERLARTHDLSYAASPDQIDNCQPGQTSLARSFDYVNPLCGIKIFLLGPNRFNPDVARFLQPSRPRR